MLRSSAETVLLLALAAGATPGCERPSESTKPSVGIAAGTDENGFSRDTALTQQAASIRAKQISHVHYDLWLALDGDDDFEGRVAIRFELREKAREASQSLLIDFEDGLIKSLDLNGVPLTGKASLDHYDGHHIHFFADELQKGPNEIEISFTHKHATNGHGFHRFLDPVDNNVYLYTDLEPYDAHRVYPCFDQPDLKASYELTVDAPDGWQVISTSREHDIAGNNNGRKTWTFPPTPLLSTYVFPVHAGPYSMWEADAHGIPLRLFARQSMAKYVDSLEWFDITRNGMLYFAAQYGHPYPYSKYDQILVPDFNANAMENAAAVTFSEYNVFRTQVTSDTHRNRADTILHELAHMWFGDLVTMRWWNGLWLNEGFATFMAAGATDSSTKFPGAWQSFFWQKQWAYWEDQLVTSHPIEVPVLDTDIATTNFDWITYTKGAAALRQLSYYLGEANFKLGVQRYIERFASNNSTSEEFIQTVGEASGKDLVAWQKTWLQTKGVNTVRAEWLCTEGKIRHFRMVQSPPDGGTELRPHRTLVGLFYVGKDHKLSASPKDALDVTYSKAETDVTSAIGRVCPDLVYPNLEDYDFVKVELDPASLATVEKSLSSIADPFVRQMLWHTLWELVVDSKLKAQDYADIVLAHIDPEENTIILADVMTNLASSRARDFSVLKILPGALQQEYQRKIETFCRRKLEEAPAGSDVQLVWLNAYLSAARSPDSLEFLLALLEGRATLPGIELDSERRWSIVRTVARLGAPQAEALIAAERNADPTDNGLRAAIAAEATLPRPETKTLWLTKMLDPTSMPIARLREALESYQRLGQDEFIRASVDAYFAQIPKLRDIKDDEYIASFVNGMFPSLCDATIVQRTTAALQPQPALPAEVLRSLKVSRQKEERCVRARQFAGGAN